jgi:hypothetical protein
LAIRVLATIPDLSPTPPEAAAPPAAPASTKRPTDKPSAITPRVRGERVPRRVRRRSVFPTSSIVALTVIAAAIWSYVAIREIRGPETAKAEQRLAADVESASQGTTRR